MPKVLVLTMRLDGGGMREALDMLGFRSYSLRDAILYPRALTHPREWVAVLRDGKPFKPAILDNFAGEGATHRKRQFFRGLFVKGLCALQRHRGLEVRVREGDVMSEWTPYDALVGPPATAAFEAILQACPRSTRVIFVAEKESELAWQMEHIILPLLNQMRRIANVPLCGATCTLLQAMLDLHSSSLSQPPQTGTEIPGRRVNELAARRAGHRTSFTDLQQTKIAWQLFEMRVKEVVPADRLLVYSPSQGWAPLCAFLSDHLLLMPKWSSGISSHTAASLPKAVPCHDGSDIALLLHSFAKYVLWLVQGCLFLLVTLLLAITSIVGNALWSQTKDMLAKTTSMLTLDDDSALVSTRASSMQAAFACMSKIIIENTRANIKLGYALPHTSQLTPQLCHIPKTSPTAPPHDS